MGNAANLEFRDAGVLQWQAGVSNSNYFCITNTPGSHNVFMANGSGNVSIGPGIPTARLDVIGSTGYNQVRMRTSYTPTDSSDANGNVGDVAWDDNYIYIKTSTGWKRASLSCR